MNVFEGKVARCAASLKCAVMLVARIGSVLSQIAELSELVRVEQTHPWWGRRLARRLRPLADLTGRRVPCLRNPNYKIEAKSLCTYELLITQLAACGRAAVARRLPRHRCPGSRGKPAAKRPRSGKDDQSAKGKKSAWSAA